MQYGKRVQALIIYFATSILYQWTGSAKYLKTYLGSVYLSALGPISMTELFHNLEPFETGLKLHLIAGRRKK